MGLQAGLREEVATIASWDSTSEIRIILKQKRLRERGCDRMREEAGGGGSLGGDLLSCTPTPAQEHPLQPSVIYTKAVSSV